MTSKYLKRFLAAQDQLTLRGNRLLLELMPKEEIKTAGGLIVATQSDHRTNTQDNQADIAVILATGSGYYSDNNPDEDVSMDVAPGNVVLISRFGIRAYSNFPGITDFVAGSIAMCRDTDINAVWESLEAYEAYKKALETNEP